MRLLARQEPLWEPGTAHGESALFYGHLVGEVLRRVDGRALGRFLWEELCGPLELDFRFGLAPRGSGPRCRADRARRRVPGADGGRSARAVRAGHLESARVAQDARVVNGTSWRGAEIPAVNGHGTARALVGFYDALARGGILSRDLLAEATRVQRFGPDLVFGGERAWGLGFGLDETGFGLGGLGGNYAGVSVDGGLCPGLRDRVHGQPRPRRWASKPFCGGAWACRKHESSPPRHLRPVESSLETRTRGSHEDIDARQR